QIEGFEQIVERTCEYAPYRFILIFVRNLCQEQLSIGRQRTQIIAKCSHCSFVQFIHECELAIAAPNSKRVSFPTSNTTRRKERYNGPDRLRLIPRAEVASRRVGKVHDAHSAQRSWQLIQLTGPQLTRLARAFGTESHHSTQALDGSHLQNQSR